MLNNIIHKQIDSLIFAEYNPRQLSDDQYKHLKDSISRFGLVDPIIINKNKDRKGIIIGGHQRVKVARTMGIKEVPCVEIDLVYDKERELNVRLNKNTGSWDYDILANTFDIDELLDWGFDDKELSLGDIEFEDETKEEIPKEIYKDSWREWANQVRKQYEVLAKEDSTFSGITPAYAKIKFLQAKYYKKEYPRHCSFAFHTHQFITAGSQHSAYEGLCRIANNQTKPERLMFITEENPIMNKLYGSSLAFASARLPLDFPANLAQKIINKYADGGKVLDPCFGWGGRLVGFLLSDAKYYYGIDVSPDQYKGVNKLKDTLLPLTDDKKVELECIAFEDNNLEQKFNLAITSPPYFDVETYIGGEQSHDRYDNYDIWKEKFYKVLIERVYDLLYDDGVFALQVGSQTYPLLQDGKEIAERVGFKIEDDMSAEMDNNFNQTEDEKKERILILKKINGTTKEI